MNLFEANRQWATRPADQRFKTLKELELAVTQRRNLSRAADVAITDLRAEVSGDGGIKVNSGIEPAVPTHWAFSQLCTLAKAPAGYLRTLPAELVVRNVNHSISRAPRDTFKVMSLTSPEGDGRTLQAVTSRTYGRIWDADVVGAVARIVERSGGRFHNPPAYVKDAGGISMRTEPSGLYASDRDCFMFMIDGGSRIEAGPRAQLNRGFMVWNSEVGNRAFGLMTFLFNEVCGNHIVWGARDVTRLIVRHTSGGPARFDREATPRLLEYVNASAAPLEAMVNRASNTKLLDVHYSGASVMDDDWLAGFAKRFDFTRGEVKEAIAFAEREEGQCESLWDMVQGLTASARTIEFIDARINLESRAGALLKLVEN